MKRILNIVGARPQIIKAAALTRAIKEHYATEIEECILHTGQHYDSNMSGVFFDELGIPEPHYQLSVGSGSHGAQTAKMIAGIEEVLMREHFDGVVVYGDTNSTLAASVAAAKLHVPVFHIEAGLRSFNMTMPEEQNRIVCDHLSNICFAPTATAMENLRREGIADSQALFADGKRRSVVNSGDVMYDNSLYYANLSASRCDIIERLGLSATPFVLATIHRDYNTDNHQRLTAIFRALLAIAHQTRVVLPLHPRTAKLLEQNVDSQVYAALKREENILIIPPASFFEIIELERHAQVVLTDSGGVQKEAFFYGRPCIILRPETEWVEIIAHGAGILADADTTRITEAYSSLAGMQVQFPPLFGDGHAAERIVQEIINY
ncbi:MAG: UDP-N-acetylglucosamine 2-epimerase (non-hydrolyzing) [Bacteroidales bacterium]|nr:UDP-N-acetylglucosamine 2-epimerase (non-hydrolyzing) [Bacteroidales bacterium]